jgi:hypothetical protein
MRPYKTIRLIEGPDVADIKSEGRKSSVGRLDQRGYFKNRASKRATRRAMKKADRNRQLQQF